MVSTRARPEVHLRVLVTNDAEWVVATDRASATALAPAFGWDEGKLAAALEEGAWASDDRFGWAVMVDGQPGGFAVVTELESGDGAIALRIGPAARGRGVGREVLRQLAEHHFSAETHLHRLTGRAHEHNVPMQRVFNAAGFRMEARYRDSYEQADGRRASEWGYALTRTDWEAGRHRTDSHGYDLHGLSFEIEETIEGPVLTGLLVKFLQDGRRAIATYNGRDIVDGELAGILSGDLLRYRFVHLRDDAEPTLEVLGRGRARLQRREDGRLEIVDQWSDERGGHGRRVFVQRVGDRPRPDRSA